MVTRKFPYINYLWSFMKRRLDVLTTSQTPSPIHLQGEVQSGDSRWKILPHWLAALARPETEARHPLARRQSNESGAALSPRSGNEAISSGRLSYYDNSCFERHVIAPTRHRWLRLPSWGYHSAAVAAGAERCPEIFAVVACC